MNSKRLLCIYPLSGAEIEQDQCTDSKPPHCCPSRGRIPVLWLAVYHHESHLDFPRMFFFLNAATTDATSAISLLELQMFIHPGLIFGTMVFFLKYGIGFNSLELGLEVANGMTMSTAVGTTTGIGEVVAIVLRLVTRGAPGDMMSFTLSMPKLVELTNCLCLHPPSSPFLGRRRRDQTWKSSEGDAGILPQYRQRGRHGHDHFACGSGSLHTG